MGVDGNTIDLTKIYILQRVIVLILNPEPKYLGISTYLVAQKLKY